MCVARIYNYIGIKPYLSLFTLHSTSIMTLCSCTVFVYTMWIKLGRSVTVRDSVSVFQKPSRAAGESFLYCLFMLIMWCLDGKEPWHVKRSRYFKMQINLLIQNSHIGHTCVLLVLNGACARVYVCVPSLCSVI